MKKNKYLLLILKEKKLIITGLLAGLLMFAAYMFFFYIPMFKSETKLFIRNIQKQDVITSFDGGSILQSESGFSNPLFNLIQILKSEELSGRVRDQIESKYPEDVKKLNNGKKWNENFSKLIKAKLEPSSDVIKIKFNWVNKDHATDVLNTVVQEFKGINLDIRKSVEIKQREYLDTQITELGDQLDTLRREIKDYRLAKRAIDIDNESIELTKARILLEKQSEELRAQISFNQSKLSDLTRQLGVPNAQVALRSTGVGQDPYLAKLRENLMDAEQRYAKLGAKFTDSYPDVIAVKNEISEIKNNITRREKETLGSYSVKRGLYDRPSQDIATDLARTQADNVSLRSQYSTLTKGIGNIISQENQLPDKLLGLEELSKEEEALTTAYNNTKQKQLEARIKENQIVDNIYILNQPSEPKFQIIQLLAKFFGFVMMGFLAAFSIALIKEEIEDRWLNAREIEDVTNLKVLGILPWLKSATSIPKDLIIRDPNSIMGVAYGVIAANISSKSYSQDAQCISFISTVASRGKSLILPNIAATLARFDKSVVIVDTDFTDPVRLLRDIDINIHYRKTDIIDIIEIINKNIRLKQEVDSHFIARIIKDAYYPVVIKTDTGEEVCFNYLCAGKKVNNIYDYVSTRGFRMVMEYLKSNYEFVLIDTPKKPFIFPEFTSIADSSDAVILMSAMESNRQALINIIDTLKKSDTKILGIIAREANSQLEKYFISESIFTHNEDAVISDEEYEFTEEFSERI